MKKIPRFLKPNIEVALKDTPVVLINGPRQSGKTTLAKEFNLPYYSLDDDNLLAAAQTDPIGFINRLDRAIIDEIQRAPQLLRAIKLSIDNNRKPGRFLLTGSANLLSIPRIGDSLAGRMEILTLLPLSTAEIERNKTTFLNNALAQEWPIANKIQSKFNLIEHILRGGYPEMQMRNEAARRSAWARAYIKSIMERDVKDIANIENLFDMPRLFEILARQSGKLTNFTQIGGQISLDVKTAQKYTNILENLFLVKRVLPWHANELNRIVKTPKLHFLDSGLLSCLLRLAKKNWEENRSSFGAILESWVFSELLKLTATSLEHWEIFYYRDKDQIEVDFILESSDRQILGLEVKTSQTVSEGDFKGLKKLASKTGKKWVTGIVLYDGDHYLSYGNSFWAIPFKALST